MGVESRVYDHGKDHSKVMEFLRNTYKETGSLENWLPPRFENNSRNMGQGIYLWEDNYSLVGFVVPESPLVYFLQIHPEYIRLYSEMAQWIEEHSKNTWGKDSLLKIIEMEGNPTREKILKDQGFARGKIYGIFRKRGLDAKIPDFKLPQGFNIRSVKPEDFDELASCIRQVFGHGEWFNREILEKHIAASFYNSDLDLVVINSGGKKSLFLYLPLGSR